MFEGNAAHVADRYGAACGNDIIVGSVLLQHQPHGAHVIAGVAPVALGVDIAKPQFLPQAELDASHSVGNFSRHELDAPQGRFVIEEYAARRVKAEAFSIIHRHPVCVQFGGRVRRAGVEGCALTLYRLLNEPVHLRRRRLIKAGGRLHEPHGF